MRLIDRNGFSLRTKGVSESVSIGALGCGRKQPPPERTCVNSRMPSMPLKRCGGKIKSIPRKAPLSFSCETAKDSRRNPSSSILHGAWWLRHAQ